MVDLHCGPCVDVGNRSGPGGREPAMLQGARRRVARAGGAGRGRPDSELNRVLRGAQGAFLAALQDSPGWADKRTGPHRFALHVKADSLLVLPASSGRVRSSDPRLPARTIGLVLSPLPRKCSFPASGPVELLSPRSPQDKLQHAANQPLRPTCTDIPQLPSIAELDVGGPADRHPADRRPVDRVGPQPPDRPVGGDSELGHRAPSSSCCPARSRTRASGLSCWWSI